MDEKDVELEEKGVKMRIKQEKRKATPSMYAYSDELTQSSIIFHEYHLKFLKISCLLKAKYLKQKLNSLSQTILQS